MFSRFMRLLASVVMLVIELITLVFMGVVTKKVYEIDKFKNKFIFTLILTNILSLLCNLTDWFIYFMRVLYGDQYKIDVQLSN